MIGAVTAAPQPWSCHTCGQEHTDLATVLGPAAPDPWVYATDAERAAGELTSDLCVLTVDAQTHYFIRGQLELPVDDPELDLFVWSVWISLSEESMAITAQHWDDPARTDLPPMFGWLCNDLPYPEPTSPLPVSVHTRAPGVAPAVVLEPDVDHPLALEQRRGISRHRVAELNAHLQPVREPGASPWT